MGKHSYSRDERLCLGIFIKVLKSCLVLFKTYLHNGIQSMVFYIHISPTFYGVEVYAAAAGQHVNTNVYSNKLDFKFTYSANCSSQKNCSSNKVVAYNDIQL